jgi:hypothetical protein
MKKDRVEREESESEPAGGVPEGDEAKKDGGEGKKAAPFVFRFLPADPKNALDFEDMADK